MSLNVANCPKCGRLFAKNIHNLCTNCIKELEKQYETCLDYLRDNRGCTIYELSEATEVPVAQIIKFIREGRISIKDNPNMSYQCEVCGEMIRDGSMCDACRQRLIKETSELLEGEKKRREKSDEFSKITYNIKDRLQDRKNK